ncbi:MAG: 3-oxoacyl-[acyl-carrier protein] reductase, partial [Solirubrobacteraceae bacterium]|nr:3-oxoacyl-[acyl-carrier protein] reductase [Solirubrobacteraceae bacterium]
MGDWETHERAADAAESAGPLAGWVNNAGIDIQGGAHEVTPADIERGLRVLQFGAMYGTAVAVRRMLRRRTGSIVNVSSIVGLHGNWGQTNYAASKAGIIGFTKSLARELGSRGVRANVVAPGYVQTRLTDVLPDEVMDLMLKNTPLGRLGDPP